MAPRTKADPFAEDDNEDEAPWPPEETKSTAKKATPKKETKNVAENNETDAVTVTLKAGGGFDAPWTVLRADSLAGMADMLVDPALNDVLRESARRAVNYSEQMPEKEGKAPAPRGGGGGRGGSPDGPEWADGLTPPECDHGAMQPRQGSRNGKLWKAWMCPTPKGTPGQCSPEWVR